MPERTFRIREGESWLDIASYPDALLIDAMTVWYNNVVGGGIRPKRTS
jgi:hypothetical protein